MSCLPTTFGTSFFSGASSPSMARNASSPSSASASSPIVNHGQLRFRSSSRRGGSGGMSPLVATGASTGANSAVSVPTGAPASMWARAARRPSAKSSALCQRCAGSLASAAITTDSSAGCTSGRSCEIGVGGSERCLSATETALSPSNGSRPQSIS